MSERDYRLEECRCWKCDKLLDVATPHVVNPNAVPHEGDVTVCYNCGALGSFVAGPDGHLHLTQMAPQEEVAAKRQCPGIQELQDAVARRLTVPGMRLAGIVM